MSEALSWRRRLTPEVELVFDAEEIRKERTGVHARVSILVNEVRLAADNFNIEKDAERGRLSNKAHALLAGPATLAYTKAEMAQDFTDWCMELWPSFTATSLAVPMGGTAVYQAPRPLLFPYILDGGGTIFFAAPGSGKSYLLLLMAASINAGVNWLWPVQQTPVLFINLERSAASMGNRLGAVNRALGLDSGTPMAFMNARGKSLADILGAAKRSVAASGAGVVILDSISRLGAGDLTENAPVNKAMDDLNNLAPAWAAIGHTPRDSSEHLFGSQMFDAAADVLVQVTSQRVDQVLGIGLRVTKANDLGPVPLGIVALGFGAGTGLLGARPAKQYEFPDIESPQAPPGPLGRSDVVARFLARNGAASPTEIAEATGLNRQGLYDVLGTPRFVKLAKTVQGQLYGLGEA